MQVMLQDDEDKEQRLDLELCTHGQGPSAFGHYLLEKNTILKEQKPGGRKRRGKKK